LDPACPVVYSTLCSSGCPYDLKFREVRNSSLVLLWATPLYEGQSPITGYMLEISQGDQSENWTLLNEKTISETHYKVREAAISLKICLLSEKTCMLIF